jgi:hypothetical protein
MENYEKTADVSAEIRAQHTENTSRALPLYQPVPWQTFVNPVMNIRGLRLSCFELLSRECLTH